jgi:hypothetical protein
MRMHGAAAPRRAGHAALIALPPACGRARRACAPGAARAVARAAVPARTWVGEDRKQHLGGHVVHRLHVDLAHVARQVGHLATSVGAVARGARRRGRGRVGCGADRACARGRSKRQRPPRPRPRPAAGAAGRRAHVRRPHAQGPRPRPALAQERPWAGARRRGAARRRAAAPRAHEPRRRPRQRRAPGASQSRSCTSVLRARPPPGSMRGARRRFGTVSPRARPHRGLVVGRGRGAHALLALRHVRKRLERRVRARHGDRGAALQSERPCGVGGRCGAGGGCQGDL